MVKKDQRLTDLYKTVVSPGVAVNWQPKET
jgi:hypothetical protein